jgi:hypothetical protein
MKGEAVSDDSGGAGRRARALEAFAAALEEARASNEPSRFLTQRLDSLATAAQASAAPSLEEDLEARYLLGWWHWFRFWALPDNEGRSDFEQAVRLLAPIALRNPDLLPTTLAPLLGAPAAAELIELVNTLDEAFANDGNVEALRHSLAIRRWLAVAIDPTDKVQKSLLGNLGSSLARAFERNWDATPRVIVQYANQDVLRSTPRDHPARGEVLNGLGSGLYRLYELSSDPASLVEAVELFSQAELGTTDGDALGAAIRFNLSRALVAHYEHFGDQLSLDEALDVTHRSVANQSPDLPGYGQSLANLSYLLLRKSESTEDLPGINLAFDTAREAVRHLPRDHPGLGDYLSFLSGTLRGVFERTGFERFLREAVQTGRQALEVTRENDPNRPTYLATLGITLQRHFEHTGDPDSLQEAISVNEQAVVSVPPNHPAWVTASAALGASLHRYYEQTGSLPVLERAIDAQRRAVAAVDPGDPDRGSYLATLSSSLHRWFERTAELDALDEAVQLGRQATSIAGLQHPRAGGYLTTLGNALLSKFAVTGDPAHSNDAVAAHRAAALHTPARHVDRAMYSANLANALRAQFEVTAETDTLTEAILLLQAAVETVPSHHPNRGGYLLALGDAQLRSFEYSDGWNLLESSRRSLAAAAGTEPSPVSVRVSAARRAIDADLRAGDIEHALAMARLAADQLPLVAPRHLHRSDRYHLITGFSGLASAAATAAVTAGRVDDAVQILEQTRGLLVADTLDTRGDFAELREVSPALAAEFDAVRQALDDLDHSRAPISANDPGGRWEQHTRARDDLLQRWDRTLRGIRALPGMSEFLLPPSLERLRHAAAHGPIVYVVIHPHASHAVLLTNTPNQITDALPLPALSWDAAVEQANLLRQAQLVACDAEQPSRRRIHAQNQVHSVLEWLWDTVTEPVLGRLGHLTTPPKGQEWPRIYWCPVGISTFLPLHAAGYHRVRSAETVIDRVVSSYIPTSRTLLNTLGSAALVQDCCAAVVVGVSDAPGTDLLPGVDVETAQVSALLPDATQLVSASGGVTHQLVIDALPQHEIAHFACHGVANWFDPATSTLVLHDYKASPLTVADIAKLRISRGTLAYLSACTTTGVDSRYADEPTHLTGAFQLAGYQSVVGTLWAVNDRAAAAITHRFYGLITNNGLKPPQTGRAAIALHDATREHRDRYPNQPTQWAAFVHTGH